VIVRIADITQKPRLEASEREILALNKIDLLGPRTAAKQLPQSGPAAISCRTGEGIDRLVDLIVTKARGDRAADAPMLAAINARHQACLQRAQSRLCEAAEKLRAGVDPELIAVPLREALDAVGEVIGAADAEEILGEIFSTFCIGK
jgi:tRNA modification GTPase